jgi:hypothetical protein
LLQKRVPLVGFSSDVEWGNIARRGRIRELRDAQVRALVPCPPLGYVLHVLHVDACDSMPGSQ